MNNRRLDDKDRELLKALQEDFPLSPTPFREVAEILGWTEEEILFRIESLIKAGILRKLGAVLAPKKMGYVSLLAAADIPGDKIDEAATVINAYRGVTHNYLREGNPNIWFTMTEPNAQTLENNLAEIEEKLGAKLIRMPVTRMFKIGVKIDV